MAEFKTDQHIIIVEIPVEQEYHQQEKMLSAIEHHPLMEISSSPGHLLLLKLWQREEDLFSRRIYLKETRLDSFRREIFQLCCFFFIFHSFFLTILFTSSSSPDNTNINCSLRKGWIPSILSLVTSIVIILLVQMKICRYWRTSRQLSRERDNNRALTRCIQELRMRGSSFDLSKEPTSSGKMKSSSVEIKWRPLTWCSQNLITISLVCFTGLAFPSSRFILCG